ncbi:MAG TPA: PQQ-binding-like beta-propeller repeat protein [Tahibacter sp.]|uniref:outer membrane protein assembly factor BamB family protein n=1 Tax=Tahibacter sp. TaxID=2056211 RepID=UPI002BD0A87F|nr:PQQ-binding-like beta-propeller repeat protein [Tahibacter sp.]HSX60920.1 PQQ-binding-like beta-propeller repeat protein [Tahibacter sp.]
MPGMSSAAAVRLYGAGIQGFVTALVAAVLWCGAAASVATAAESPRDPVEGRWWGTAGSAREKIEVGLHFVRGADGKLTMRITQPISNYFDADPGGEVKRDGDRVVHEDMALSLQLAGDTLSGTYPGPNSPAVFERAKQLPAEAPPPKLPAGPEPRWETRIGGQVYASPAVADGVAYIGTTGGIVNAVDTRDGNLRWTFTTGAPVFASAAVSGDAVYVTADNGLLYRLNRNDGKERWRYALGDAGTPRVLPHPQVFDWDWQGAQPVVADDTVYVGAGDGSFHAVAIEDGKRRWRFATRAAIRNAAAVDGETVYVGSMDNSVYALARADGRERWRNDTGAAVDAAPIVHEGRVLVGNRGAGLLSIDAASGETKWRLYFWGSWVESTPVVRDGVIYVGSSDLRRVSAIDPADGRAIWRTDVYGWTWGTPLVTKKYIYAGVAGGTPYFVRHVASFSVLDRRSGKLVARRPLPDTGGHQWGIAGSPVLAGDTVVVATIAGSLIGIPVMP